MKQVLHHSIFEPLSNGHGGEKRSYQLLFEAQKNGYVFCNLELRNKDKVTLRRLWCAMWLLLKVYRHSPWLSLKIFFRRVRDVAYYYDQLIAFFQKTQEQVFLWESVRPELYFLPYLAKKYGKRVIAFPHNTESLVPNQKPYLFRMSKLQAFQWEIKVLGTCDEVYAISHEETWLLNLWGVKTRCYLYSPVGVAKEQVLLLKEQRGKTQDKSFFLLLGTAINQPTRMGMQHLIDLWKKENMQVPLHIGGYGTDLLHIPKEQSNIVFLGELSDSKLMEEQIHTRALLVYQPPTTGALTRISEATMAGIPVIVNYAAARSYYNCDNVYVYQEDMDLIKILNDL